MKKIGVIGIEDRWSSEKLADTIDKKTGFRCLIDMNKIYFDLEKEKVFYNEIDLDKLDALIIKKIGPNYSADYIDRLEILRFLNKRGLKTFSKPKRIMNLLDRLSCTVTLKLNNIPIPPTVITEDINHALDTLHHFKCAVFKPLYTSKARGMRIIDAKNNAFEKIMEFKESGNPIMYIQKYMKIPEKDLGIVFLGGKYLGTYARIKPAGSWNTSTDSGGKYEPYEPSDKIIKIAHKAQKSFRLDFTCVDLVETKNGPYIFEVSAFGGFRGLWEAHGIDVAELYVNYVLKEL